MGKSSKRYFNHRDTGRNRSPQSESSRYDRTLSSHKWQQSPSRNNTLHQSSRHSSSTYDNNKFASEKLKQTIQEQLKDAASKTSLDHTSNNPPKIISNKSNKIFIPLEDQIKMMNKIDEINNDSFKPKHFISSRAGQNSGNSFKNNPINLSEIPLPKDVNSWRDNPKLLLGSKLLDGNPDSRKQKWKENLLHYARKLLEKQN